MLVAEEGLKVMEKWMKSIGLVMNITDLGATPEMLEGMVAGTRLQTGGYKVLTESEIREVLKASY